LTVQVPAVSRAYRLFSDYGLMINMYTSPGVFDSQVEHAILSMPETVSSFLGHSKLLTEASH